MRVLVTGASGQLGSDLVDLLQGRLPLGSSPELCARALDLSSARSIEVLGTDHEALDVTDEPVVKSVFQTFGPEVVVHAAAWTDVDGCELDPDSAFAVNALGSRHIARAASDIGAHVIYVSTDYVFDGSSAAPYCEWDEPNPLSVYGRSKLAGEREMRPGATVVRTSWVSGYTGNNMVKTVIRLAGNDGPLRFVDDQRGCPTFTADLASVLAWLCVERTPGVMHVTNQGATNWFEFAQEVLQLTGGDPSRVEPIQTADLSPARPAKRPANSVLDNTVFRLNGWSLLPVWQLALQRLVDAL